MGIKAITLAVSALALSITSFNSSAVVVNTLNGVEYAWLELTETLGESRTDIELRLADPNDQLYGYQYANAEQIEALFTSYTSWDGLDGIHTSGSVVSGVLNLINDFGYTYTSFTTMDNPYYATSVGSGDFTLNNAPFTDQVGFTGFYGDSTNCGGLSCSASTYYIYGNFGYAVDQRGSAGWGVDSSSTPNLDNPIYSQGRGHFLLTTDLSLVTVPIPTAAWLFGSGLLGLVGLARRKHHV